MELHLRKLEQIYMEIEIDRREPLGRIPSPWLLKNIYFWYDGESPTNNEDEKKYFLQQKKKERM